MCTAASYLTKDFYFGRNLDYESSYGEGVTVTPKQYVFSLKNGDKLENHYAIIGMAHVTEGYPLYYDGMNEKGLCIAGLNFVGNAVYRKETEGKTNIAQFELIPWILGRCESVKQVRKEAENLNITDTPYSEFMPTAQLHWIIADRKECIVIESVKEGIKIYDNPVGVLTNNPPFPMQMFALNNYMSLSSKQPTNSFSEKFHLETYSRGMGGIGLPGDLSSQSRFIRAAFVKTNSVSGDTESESISQFFQILGSVSQQKGCCEVAEGEYEFTQYSSCCNADKGIYYYTSYNNSQITAVDMNKEDINGKELVYYPLREGQNIFFEN